MSRLSALVATACAASLVFTNVLPACTVIAVGKDASADGSVIISHSDAGPDSRIRVVRGQDHPPGAEAAVHWGIQDATLALDDFGEVLGTIPQVERTFTYFHSTYPQMNEHQLAIAESTTSQRPELAVERGQGDQIMTIEQAQVFALQRCTKARNAVRLHDQSPQAARDYLTAYTVKNMERVPEIFISLREALIVKYSNNRE